MAYVKQRNTAYKGAQFFVCDFNGADWLTDTYIAEPDTEPPRITKDTFWKAIPHEYQGIKKPLLGSIVNPDECTVEFGYPNITEHDVMLRAPTKSNLIQRRYYDYFTARYPKAKFYGHRDHELSPIIVRNGNDLVGIVMPMRDK